MSQIETGLRSILSSPRIYNFMQDVMGAKSTRKEYVKRYMPFENGDRVLDIGCGTAEIVSQLPSGVNYIGYDMSSRYIEFAAKKFEGKGHFNIGLVNSLEVEGLPSMDWVIAIGLLHHLCDEEARGLMKLAKKALKYGGKFIAIDPCFTNPQNAIARWLIAKDRGENVRSSEGYLDIAEQVFFQVEADISHRSWIPYTHNILVCKK